MGIHQRASFRMARMHDYSAPERCVFVQARRNFIVLEHGLNILIIVMAAVGLCVGIVRARMSWNISKGATLLL